MAAMQFRLKDLLAIQLVQAIGIGMLVFAFRSAAVLPGIFLVPPGAVLISVAPLLILLNSINQSEE
jgi:hypothetical protein